MKPFALLATTLATAAAFLSAAPTARAALLVNVAPTATAATALSETVVGGDSVVNPSVNAPAEGNAQAIDGTTATKFLAFGGFAGDDDASDTGIIFFFDAPVRVDAVRFGFAADSPERDPATYTLEGSNSVSPADYGFDPAFFTGLSFGAVADAAEWTPIVGAPARTGLAEDTDTFLDTVAARSTFSDEAPFNRSADPFVNDTAYSAYRILFPDLRLAGNGIIQVGEIELLAANCVPEPGSFCLAGLLLTTATAATSRRRRG